MSYATSDFTESLGGAGIERSAIDTVIAAWGKGSGQGKDTGPGWSEDEVTEWSGGFLLRLKDGRYAYVWGWCDYTGWGCQDGVDVRYYDSEPSRELLTFTGVGREQSSDPSGWDEQPADLNRWLSQKEDA